jgi:hypothetical protein
VRDRSEPGHERAGHVTYAVLVSRNGGAGYDMAVGPRPRPFTEVLPLRGRRTHLFVASVCDDNGNCASRRLGRFRAR